jgi:Fic family protein
MSDLTYGLAPFLSSDPDHQLRGKAYRLAQQSATLSAVPSATREALQTMLRGINTYHSNLIEGQSTHPLAVDRAIRTGQQDHDSGVLISLAVSEAEQTLDTLRAMADDERATRPEMICEIHRLIFAAIPESERVVRASNSSRSAIVEPGAVRSDAVTVGQHEAIDHREVSAALDLFDRQYRADQKSLRGDVGLVAAAAAHHRLAFIHPFVDGNGRVARLFSRAYIDSVLEDPAIWSLSRGLARRRQDYYRYLAAADAQRAGDLDGRGPRSARGLFEFCEFFLDQCIDQVAYMCSVLNIDGYKQRVDFLVQQASVGALPDVPPLDTGAAEVIKALFIEGEMRRSEASRRTGYQERKGRQVIGQLLHAGLAVSPNRNVST